MTAENLMNLLDSLTETSVYVIEEESHRLLYFNERCRNTGRGRAALGIRCDEVWPELCANCPLKMLGDRVSNHMVCYDPLLKLTVDVTANRINWEGRVPAVVITAAPHRLNFEEEQGFQKIRQMYASSLVTVFDECIIANLTRDYYVSCQKDVVWDDIPEQGNFGSENRKYAQKALHPDDLECFNENFSRESMLCMFTEGKKQITRRLRRRADNGSYRTVEFTAARIGNQEDECWCVLVFRDVQDELLLEQERNVEISQLVGKDNIYIFGESSEQVIEHYEKADYCSRDFYEKDERIRRAVDFIVGNELLSIGSEEHLRRLHHEIVSKDWFMTLLDFEDYAKVKDQALSDYEDRTAWAEKMLVNIGKAGYFSSDRTIEEYNRDIWHLTAEK